MTQAQQHVKAVRDSISEGRRFSLYAYHRRHMEAVWELVKPVKFPNRRRREDRELPKKAA